MTGIVDADVEKNGHFTKKNLYDKSKEEFEVCVEEKIIWLVKEV